MSSRLGKPEVEPTVKVTENKLELGVGLTDRLISDEFNPENYKYEYRIRVLAMLV